MHVEVDICNRSSESVNGVKTRPLTVFHNSWLCHFQTNKKREESTVVFHLCYRDSLYWSILTNHHELDKHLLLSLTEALTNISHGGRGNRDTFVFQGPRKGSGVYLSRVTLDPTDPTKALKIFTHLTLSIIAQKAGHISSSPLFARRTKMENFILVVVSSWALFQNWSTFLYVIVKY